MGPSQICGCPFREPRVFTIAHIILLGLKYSKNHWTFSCTSMYFLMICLIFVLPILANADTNTHGLSCIALMPANIYPYYTCTAHMGRNTYTNKDLNQMGEPYLTCSYPHLCLLILQLEATSAEDHWGVVFLEHQFSGDDQVGGGSLVGVWGGSGVICRGFPKRHRIECRHCSDESVHRSTKVIYHSFSP